MTNKKGNKQQQLASISRLQEGQSHDEIYLLVKFGGP